jgi:hypothetical protein
MLHHLFEPGAAFAMADARVVPPGPDSDARTEKEKMNKCME